MKKNNIKVAIVHDLFDDYGGSESVALIFLEMYPQADIYTFMVSPRVRSFIKKRYKSVEVHTSLWQYFFGFVRLRPVLKIVCWLYWLRLDLAKYDLVISSSHSYGSKLVRARKGCHVCYVHTPPKYLYMSDYELNIFPVNVLFRLIKCPLKYFDRLGSRSPDLLIANSREVKNRIKKFYERDSIVVNPPVNLGRLVKKSKKRYFVCFSRLVRQKGVELAVKTCSRYGLPLLVVGDGLEKKYLESIAGKTVKFWGYCKEKDKYKIYTGAKALIFSAKDEDFGIVPVESMSFGVPVIAYNSGGVKETVTDKTGIFFDDYSLESLKEAIDKFDSKKIDRKECIKRANAFKDIVFVNKMKGLINRQLRTKFV